MGLTTGLVKLDAVISAKELAQRWDMDDWTFGEITWTDHIQAYRLKDARKLVNGTMIYLCNGPYVNGIPYTEEFGNKLYDLSGYVFDFNEIHIHETMHPEYLQPRPIMPTINEYISAEKVRLQLEMSPIEFVDMLNGHNNGKAVTRLITSSEEWYREDAYNTFSTKDIASLTVHYLDLKKYLNETSKTMSVLPEGVPPFLPDFPAFPDESILEKDPWELPTLPDESTSKKCPCLDHALLSAELKEEQEAIENLRQSNRELSEENLMLKNTVEEKDTQIGQIRAELESLRNYISDQTAIGVVLKMREAGNTGADIARCMKERGLTYSQIGALLHSNPFGVENGTIMQYAKRLLGVV